MTAGPLVEVSETCRCGASTTVKAPARSEVTGRGPMDHAEQLVERWRAAHRCDPVDERDRGRTGAGSSLPGGPHGHRTGFAAPEVLGPYRWRA